VEVLPAPPEPPGRGDPALTVVQPAGEGERAVLDVEGEVVDVQAAGGHHLDGFEVLHLPVVANVDVGDVGGPSDIHAAGHEGQRPGLGSTLGRDSSCRAGCGRGTAQEPGGCPHLLPPAAFLAMPTQARLPGVTAALPGLLPSPSPRSVCPLAPGLSGAGGNTLNPCGAGRTAAGFAGRAGSSAAALALCCLHKAFLQISGSHPRHGAGNYRRLRLASIGNGPTAKPFPICSSPGAGRLPALCREYKARGGACPRWARGPGPGPSICPPDFGRTHNSLMRMSGTQMLSTGREIRVRLSKRAGSHLRNSSVQCWGQGRGAWRARSPPPCRDPAPKLAPCRGSRSSAASVGGGRGLSSGCRTTQRCEARSTNALPGGSRPTEVSSSPGMGPTLLHASPAFEGVLGPGGARQGCVVSSLTCLYQMYVVSTWFFSSCGERRTGCRHTGCSRSGGPAERARRVLHGGCRSPCCGHAGAAHAEGSCSHPTQMGAEDSPR